MTGRHGRGIGIRRRRWVAFSLFALAMAAQADDRVPYAMFQPTADGDLGEWTGPSLQRDLTDGDAPGAVANRMSVRVVWTLDALWIGGRIDDRDLWPAPERLSVEQFHQYDSVQVYLDPLGDSGAQMNRDDLDVLLLPDGREGALRGDELIGSLVGARVPQRQMSPLAADYAARRDSNGWTFELAVPWAGMGVSPVSGRKVRLDVAMNDWVVTHAPAPEAAVTIEALRDDALPSAPEPAPEVGTQLWPLTWTGQRDFGYPERWMALRLSGDAPAVERWWRRVGPRAALFQLGVAAVSIGLLVWFVAEWRARRRIRALLASWRNAAPPVSSDAVVGSAPSEPVVEVSSAMPEAPERSGGESVWHRQFAARARDLIRSDPSADWSPAALAAALNVSVRSLQRHLRQGVDASPQELVLATRLSVAHELLRQGGLRVGEVAYRVGFDDASHFTRRFRAAYGLTPTAWSEQAAADTLARADQNLSRPS